MRDGRKKCWPGRGNGSEHEHALVDWGQLMKDFICQAGIWAFSFRSGKSLPVLSPFKFLF